MQFMESRSHQFPLAANLVVSGGATVDPIDQNGIVAAKRHR